MFFDNYPEFIVYDPRKNREHVKLTSESLSNRCDVILPDYLVKDRSILDFGSALGAMGHYALLNGAKHYTGIEIQKPYIEKSKELLSKYHTNWDIKETFDDKTYDIVLACGSIHGFFDIFGI